MYLSLDWIKQWVKLPKEVTPQQLAQSLTMSTVEVEQVIDQAKSLQQVVVGKIKEITKHPQADRLQVCAVDLGDNEEQIVCGGSNLTKGMLVAVAKVGSQVRWHGQGELVTLTEAKIRGILSRGMIVASEEIGLGNLFPAHDDHEIIDLTAFRFKPGTPLASALRLDDTIIDIDNKSINHRPDLWGQYGLAREVAAIFNTKLKPYEDYKLASKKESFKLKVIVKDQDKCYRYLGLALTNIKVEPSPWWLQIKLQAVGIRPINNIVDVTNYVMYELGQPLHAFDARQIQGHQIEVKTAQAGEEFITLDGVKRNLPAGALMIADKNKYVALAGIMGGQNSEISDDTTEIIIESANFQAASIRRTSLALGLRSESSARFEKSLDPRLAEQAIMRTAQMILEILPSAQIASKLIDINHNPFGRITLEVPEDLINRRFGAAIAREQIKNILARLQFGVKYKNKIFTVDVPSWRATKDISIPEDIVEEVARIYGYDNITPDLPQVTLQPPYFDVTAQAAMEVSRWLAFSQGYNEVYTYAFTDLAWAQKLGLDPKKHLKVKNAVSPEQSRLNISLLPNLLRKAEENTRFFSDIKIFEMQRVFNKTEPSIFYADQNKKDLLPMQDKYLAGVMVAPLKASEVFLQVKGLVESLQQFWHLDWELVKNKLSHSTQAYSLKYQGLILGNFGLLNKNLFDAADPKINIGWWEFNFSLLSKYISRQNEYQTLAKYPSSYRDMSVIVDQNQLWQNLAKEISKISPLIVEVEPFDIFSGGSIPAGKKSIAWHLEFRSPDKTLLTEDVDELMDKISAVLQQKFKAAIR